MKINRLIYILIAIALLLGSAAAGGSASAQSTGGLWGTPVNLSHSGGANLPRGVIDSRGVMHFIWIDNTLSYFYTRFEEGAWTDPIAVRFPFAPFSPQLVADNQSHIHAFWIDERGRLFASNVNQRDFGNAAAWRRPQYLAELVLDFDVTIDERGVMQIAFISGTEIDNNPVGIYVRRSHNRGFDWTGAKLLYESQYFRSIDPAQAHVEISSVNTGEASRTIVAWDNRARRQIFYTTSVDQGLTFGEAVLLESPAAGAETTNPSNIQVSASLTDSMLIWQNGSSEGSCTHYYQVSSDGGDTWGERQQMLTDLTGCAQQSHLFRLDDGLILLEIIIQGQVYLSLWDGQGWSEAQSQPELFSFTDPEIFSSVQLACHQSIFNPTESRLYVAGCDATGAGDIWLLNRRIDRQLVSEQSTEPEQIENGPVVRVWQPAVEIARSSTGVGSPLIVTAPDHSMHAIWSQPDATGGNSMTGALYYSGWNGERWSRPVEILRSPQGMVMHPSAAIDASGRLHVVWSGGVSGEIYYSWASADKAFTSKEWSPARRLPLPRQAGLWPNLVIEPNGRFSLVYTIPYNEQRGIYLIQSVDGGLTWSEPVVVFDGVAAGWEGVAQPELGYTADGQLHLLWMRLPLPETRGPLGLFYSRSADGGRSWSPPESLADSPAGSYDLISFGLNTLHRFWQEVESDRLILKHQVSYNSGATWGEVSILSNAGGQSGPVSLSIDPAGQIHVFQGQQEEKRSISVIHWMWDGTGWRAGDNFNYNSLLDFHLEGLGAAYVDPEQLSIIFTGTEPAFGGDRMDTVLYQASRSFTLPTVLPTQAPVPTLSAETLAPETIITPQPTATVRATDQNPAAAQQTREPLDPVPEPGNKWTGLILGTGLTLLAAGLVIAAKLTGFMDRWR